MDNTHTQSRGNAFAHRMMRSNLRPVVLFIAFATGLYSLLWVISSFKLVTDPNVESINGLMSAALSTGILYIFATAHQVFGLFAVWLRKPRLVGIYKYSSIITALCIFAGSLTRIVIHFTQKKALLGLCTSENTGDTIFFSWGIWGPVSSTTLTQAQAARWCNEAYNRATWNSIITFLIQILIAVFFLYIIFGYHKQLLDPSSAGHGFRPQNQYPLGTYPQQQFVGFAPPQGPPPPGSYEREDQSFVPPYDSAKLPAYDGSGQSYGDAKDGQGPLKRVDDDPFGDHRNDAGRSDSGHGDTRR